MILSVLFYRVVAYYGEKKNAIKDSELKKMCCQVQPLYKHLHNYQLKEKKYITDDSKGKKHELVRQQIE